MKKSDLKQVVAQLDVLGISDDAEILVEHAIDNSIHSLQNLNFTVKGKDATYSIGPDDHWVEAISQANIVILKE